MRHKMLLDLARDRQEEIRREVATLRKSKTGLTEIQLSLPAVVILVVAALILSEILT